MKVKCEWCQGPIIDPDEDERFCSDECDLDAAYERHVDNLIDEARERARDDAEARYERTADRGIVR